MVIVGAERLATSGSQAAGVAAVIDGYRPQGVSAAAGMFARTVVASAAPGSPARARALLFAGCRLAAFGEGVGLELGEALLCEAVIERFVLEGAGTVSSATRRTLRTNLRALARLLERYPEPAPVALARERAKAPYSEAEIDGYLRLAAAQGTRARRMHACALICLGAGAGSSPASCATYAAATSWRPRAACSCVWVARGRGRFRSSRATSSRCVKLASSRASG